MKKIKQRLERLFSRYNLNIVRELISGDFKVYDHNSVLGVLWSLLSPAATFLVMYFVFENRFGRNVPFYPLYLLIGIVMVNFFINVTGRVLKSISSNRNILLNSKILQEDFILAEIFVQTYKFVIELILCLAVSLCYGLFSWKALLLALPLLVAFVGLVSGIGFVLGLLHCFATDIEHIWRIVSRLFLFVTPIFYSLENITPGFSKVIYWANPVTPFLIAFRQLIGGVLPFEPLNYLYCLILGCAILSVGYFTFVIFENKAIERI